MIQKTILILTFIIGFSLSTKEETIKIVFKEPKKETKPNHYQIKFKETIEFIKKHEGFREKAYKDINGYPTIGYGFMTAYINKRFRYKITREQADSILNNKLITNIKIVKKKYPDLNKFRTLAIAHLIYCKGLGRIQKHLINQQIKVNKINKNTLIYFSKYEVERPHYRKTRTFEWNLWNYNPI